MMGVSARTASPARILLLACAGAVAFATLTASAEAKKQRKKAGPVVAVSQVQTLAPEQSAAAVAACPDGTTLVGGGFSSGPLDAESLEGIVVSESRRQGNGWLAGAANLSFTDPGTVTAYAYCRKRTAPLVEVAVSIFNCFCTPQIEAVATCPTGSKPLGGGFAGPLTAADGGVLPQISKRFGAFAWKYAGFDAGIDPGTVTAYAYCAPKAALETSGVRVIEGANVSGTAYAQQCRRRGRKLLAGGFEARPYDPFGGSIQLITASGREGGRWVTTAVEAFLGPGTLTSYGYCR